MTLTVNGMSGQPVLQPQMGEALTATLSDDDTPVPAGIKWQWYRGSTERSSAQHRWRWHQ